MSIESGDADENMNMVRAEAEAWRLVHSRYAQNTLSTQMISGSLKHDRADEHNQLPDEFVAPMDSKEHMLPPTPVWVWRGSNPSSQTPN